MIIAFALYKYFPYGGLQRDFLRIAQAVQDRGHQVRVYCNSWQGDMPDQFERVIVPIKGYTSQAKNRFFSSFMQQQLEQRPVGCVVGFNKMPGLDVYYAADSCYKKQALKYRPWLYRFSGRYRHFKAYEEAIFARNGYTQILLLSPLQQEDFIACYGTEESRLHLLPPGIEKDRKAPANAEQIRSAFRQEFDVKDDEYLLLQVGSGFSTKGVDRTLKAMAALPKQLLEKTMFHVVGQDKEKKFKQLAMDLDIAERVTFFEGRDDIPRFLQGADLLVHPARAEAAGMILVEAVIAGLPVLTTQVCGYAAHVSKAAAGKVMGSPFEQNQLNELLCEMLMSPSKLTWKENGLRYADAEDLYSLTQVATDFIEAQVAAGGVR